MMEPHHHQPSSQAGDSHIFQEPETLILQPHTSVLGEVERINKESSKIKLLDADKAAALMPRNGP